MNAKINHVVSFSGGKDSTAMLLMMLARGESVHSAVFFDTGWEFPEMIEHIEKVKALVDIPIVTVSSPRPFDYWLYERKIIARKGPLKEKVHRIGNGWPSFTRRWCTRQKINSLDKYQKTIPDAVKCIGFAADENRKIVQGARYPLMEYGVTEADALEYCKGKGFDWGGLYDHFSRVSCFCCPLQGVGELKKLRKHYPDLWARMLSMDAAIPGRKRGFMKSKTVHDLDARFAMEDRQMELP